MLDPFCGCGTTVEAAERLRRRSDRHRRRRSRHRHHRESTRPEVLASRVDRAWRARGRDEEGEAASAPAGQERSGAERLNVRAKTRLDRGLLCDPYAVHARHATRPALLPPVTSAAPGPSATVLSPGAPSSSASVTGYSGHGTDSLSANVLEKFPPRPLPADITRRIQSLMNMRARESERSRPTGSRCSSRGASRASDRSGRSTGRGVSRGSSRAARTTRGSLPSRPTAARWSCNAIARARRTPVSTSSPRRVARSS